jgi:uncharacterized protein
MSCRPIAGEDILKGYQMANVDPRLTQMGRAGTDAAQIDQGLRSYMLGIYNMMALGVALTGLIAMYVGNNDELMKTIFVGPLKYVAMFAPLAVVLVLSFGINKLSAGAAQALYWVYAALMGFSISYIFVLYEAPSIAKTFFITAATFGALSLYGYTTKKSLSGWGTFLFMGLIGLIIASVVNIFLKSDAMSFVISAAGVLIFAGLTAYDTQKLKEMYFEGDDGATLSKKITMGALTLYMDFINLFMYLLRFLGNRE